MSFDSLKQTNQKLASNPELSEHNKEVLEAEEQEMQHSETTAPASTNQPKRYRDLERTINIFNIDEMKTKAIPRNKFGNTVVKVAYSYHLFIYQIS